MERFTPKQYLMIDIASNFGLDKKKWNERLEWFHENQDKLDSLMPQAKEPALFFAGVQAWKQVQAGEPIGYPISLDATCSGLQILSVLTGDRNAAKLCNVVDTGKREDAYVTIYEDMVNELGESAKISRDDTKQAIMTSLYGSQAIPKEVFGEGLLLYTFYEAMKRNAPAAWELNEYYLAIWNPTIDLYKWVLPDNFHVNIKIIDQVKETVHFLNKPYDTFKKVQQPIENGRSLGANTTHSIDGMIVREVVRRCNYKPYVVANVKELLVSDVIPYTEAGCADDHMVETLWGLYLESGYLSARILDHLNDYNINFVERTKIWELVNSLPAKPFEVITVHDCFRCLPNYGNDLREQYNLQLHLIAKSNMLSHLLGQLLGKKVNIGKLDASMADDILSANYALS